MITQENITSHELVGLEARVAWSSNRQVIGLNGTVVDETKSMLTIETPGGTKMLPKDTCTWEFQSNGITMTVSGHDIAKRPHDRLGGRHG